MADEEVRDNTLALATDLPPDRIGDRAFRIKNLLPRSKMTAAPRAGTSLVGHYTAGSTGRQIIVDTLPGRSDDEVLIVCVNTRSGPASTAEGLFRYRAILSTHGAVQFDPDDVGGTDWGAGGDESVAAHVYGWVL